MASNVGRASQAYVESLIEQMAFYLICNERAAAKTRHLQPGPQQAAYAKAYEEWQQDPTNSLLYEPTPGDEKAKEAHFAKCNVICEAGANTVNEALKIFFASWAGIQVMENQIIRDMIEGNAIVKAAGERAYATLSEQSDTQLQDRDQIERSLPEHIANAYYPKDASAGPDTEQIRVQELDHRLVGQTIRYRDERTGDFKTCSVVDCGSSHVRGKWFAIIDDEDEDGGEIQITMSEMQEIWDSRVPR